MPDLLKLAVIIKQPCFALVGSPSQDGKESPGLLWFKVPGLLMGQASLLTQTLNVL